MWRLVPITVAGPHRNYTDFPFHPATFSIESVERTYLSHAIFFSCVYYSVLQKFDKHNFYHFQNFFTHYFLIYLFDSFFSRFSQGPSSSVVNLQQKYFPRNDPSIEEFVVALDTDYSQAYR